MTVNTARKCMPHMIALTRSRRHPKKQLIKIKKWYVIEECTYFFEAVDSIMSTCFYCWHYCRIHCPSIMNGCTNKLCRKNATIMNIIKVHVRHHIWIHRLDMLAWTNFASKKIHDFISKDRLITYKLKNACRRIMQGFT